jgi:hypothetical protein
MTAHNLIIQDFIKVLKEMKAKGYSLVDLEIKDDLTLSIKGIETSKKDSKKNLDIDWEQLI